MHLAMALQRQFQSAMVELGVSYFITAAGDISFGGSVFT